MALSQVDRKLSILFKNDSELAGNSDNHDVQFCTMMRIFISHMNKVTDRVNSMLPAEADKIPPLTYAGVNAEFINFTQFRSRPNFAKFIGEWFMGEDVSELGFAEEPDAAPREDENPGGDVEFGGDYGENQGRDGDEPEPATTEAADAVPEVPPADAELGGPEDGPQGVEVQQGRDGDEANQEAGVVTPPDPSSSAAL
jgi:hypothetical protein